MLSIVRYLRDSLVYLRNERGLEVVEWVMIGAIITAIAIVVYPGTLQTAMTTAMALLASTIAPAP
ncbi:MAG: hypothetical protein V3U33_03650 [candidate division NC10 bacterium]